MKILITGASGFVGKNLAQALMNIRDGKDRTHPELHIDGLYLFDVDSDSALLDEGCRNADFVFNLAGVNRPKSADEFLVGNRDFAQTLLEKLESYGNTCPVMLASSVQATLVGRYDGDYGRSKKAGEDIFFAYGERTGARVLVYRFPNLFGKWCRPNYNSAVATFCHNVARDLPITVTDPAITLELVYIDDLVSEMLAALAGRECRCEFDGTFAVKTEHGRYCTVPVSHKVSLGEIVDLLRSFREMQTTLNIPAIPDGSFAKKLYSTYLSYLPPESSRFPLRMNVDARGSFTELLRTDTHGQISVNVSLPGITKGQHWHNTKWEIFVVVSGRGLIRQRKIDTDEVVECEVTGEHIEAVMMLPGYTHSIVNLSDTEPLVTLMWANERFDPDHPDTYFLPVD